MTDELHLYCIKRTVISTDGTKEELFEIYEGKDRISTSHTKPLNREEVETVISELSKLLEM